MIALAHGFSDWKQIYDHDLNRDLRAKRGNPNVLYPGDRVVIPDRTTKTAACRTGSRSQFVVRSPSCKIRIRAIDFQGKPLAGKKYELRIGTFIQPGSVPADGVIEATVPARIFLHPSGRQVFGQLQVTLDELDPPEVYEVELRFGHLDPVEEVSGVQGRLNNLGYTCGDENGTLGPKTREAISLFQKHQGLPVDGETGPALRDKLKAVFGF